MLHRILRNMWWILSGPLSIILLVFAVSNREFVALNFWPFDWQLQLPLFLPLYLVLVLGLLIGFSIASLRPRRAKKYVKERTLDVQRFQTQGKNNRLKAPEHKKNEHKELMSR